MPPLSVDILWEYRELGMKKENVTGIYLKMESLLQLLVMSDSDQRMGGTDESAKRLFLFYLFRQTSY